MDKREREELAEHIADALASRGVAEGARLLDLMRAEQNLVDALRVVRQEIAIIVRASRRPEGD